MSFDNPSGSGSSGENRPDRGGDRPEDRPRPGGSRDRPEPTPVTHVPTTEELRARRAGLTDSRDYEGRQAAQKNTEANGGDGSRTSAAGSGADSASGVRDAPNSPRVPGRDPGSQPGADAGPGGRGLEGAVSSDQPTFRRFPDAPAGRPGPEMPSHAPAADEVRARRAGLTDSRQYESVRAEQVKAENTKGQAAEKTDGGHAARQSDRSPDQGRPEAGADDSQESEREGRARESESADRQSGRDASAPKARDHLSVLPQEPDTPADGPDETGTEARPDEQADEQRWAALEQRMAARIEAAVDQRVQAATEDIKAEVRAEVTAEVTADYEAKLDKQQAKIDELEAEARQRTGREGVQGADDQPARAEKKPDILKPGDRQDSPESNTYSAEISQRRKEEPASTERQTTEFRERRWFTVKNATAVGSAVSFSSSITALFAHMPPEVAVGPAAISAATGIWGSTIIEQIRKKRRDQR